MKTYYGQMTREELNKKYFVPSTVKEMNQFIEMCGNAGYECGVSKNEIRTIGVNCFGNNRFGSTPLEHSFYENEGMTQINWHQSENKKEQQDLKSKLEKSVAKRNKLKAKLDKLSDKLKKADTELNSITVDIENEYESVDGVKCTVSLFDKKDEEMDNPDNWQIGDIVECINSIGSCAEKGKSYRIENKEFDKHDDRIYVDVRLDNNTVLTTSASRFKFISRPQ